MLLALLDHRRLAIVSNLECLGKRESTGTVYHPKFADQSSLYSGTYPIGVRSKCQHFARVPCSHYPPLCGVL